MHDPLSVAHTIPNPFLRPHKHRNIDGSVWKYRKPLVTIWHKDPESDGSDDSCGWFAPKLTKRQIDNLRLLAGDEARNPWFLAYRGKELPSAADAECLLRGVFLIVAQSLRVKITLDEATRWSSESIHNPIDNIRGTLAFLPGWHSNVDEDREEDRKEQALRLFCIVGRNVLRKRRPWYRHPRWHVHHWELQVHPVHHFKRWAFSRCDRCGRRFRWGESPVSGSWHGTGPQWFRSEKQVRHGDCDRPGTEAAKSAEVNAA